MSAESRLKELGIELPKPAEPMANYLRAKQLGNTLYVAGHGPARGFDDSLLRGKVGGDLTLDQGYQAARLVGLNLLASMRAELGSLDRVKSIVKVLGMVNCAPGFDKTPQVINGCSDLLVEIFGPEIGRHARAAVGMAELPNTIPVEIEMVVEVS